MEEIAWATPFAYLVAAFWVSFMCQVALHYTFLPFFMGLVEWFDGHGSDD